jgi:lipid-binding SYLF domain-containing protein
MRRRWMTLGTSLLLLILSANVAPAQSHELKTVEAASDTLQALGEIPARCIPYTLMREARGVAIIPGVVKAGFLIDGRFGRGVVAARQPDGCWSSPVFITLTGGGIGLQAGVQSTDVVLVFRTAHSMDRFLHGKGKLTLGGDLSIAAGPVGREAEAGTDVRLRAEIISYSRSRGLFAGASLEGAALLVDHRANDAFYGFHPPEVAAQENAAIDHLKAHLVRMSTPPSPPVYAVPPSAPQVYVAPPAPLGPSWMPSAPPSATAPTLAPPPQPPWR